MVNDPQTHSSLPNNYDRFSLNSTGDVYVTETGENRETNIWFVKENKVCVKK